MNSSEEATRKISEKALQFCRKQEIGNTNDLKRSNVKNSIGAVFVESSKMKVELKNDIEKLIC